MSPIAEDLGPARHLHTPDDDTPPRRWSVNIDAKTAAFVVVALLSGNAGKVAEMFGLAPAVSPERVAAIEYEVKRLTESVDRLGQAQGAAKAQLDAVTRDVTILLERVPERRERR